MTTKLIVKSEAELFDVAAKLLGKYPESRIFALYGEMGAGKTTFVKNVCRHLDVFDDVVSPTFSIINEYHTLNNQSVYHFDFYRIKKIEEAFDLGYEDYFFSGAFCFLEWPELIESLLPEDAVKVWISTNEDDQIRLFSF
ncbi:MAG TPA: tRNA (adenosine(37)-N6)-threonylcarbamoyltransferase complex ATPase subunit type 1 TsaE [Bacteroidales bacterium]|nr:tRNA (adenosine(37)-N6)-threonylcarbamoyltransferase complex ATPase subunit type 1 TsaE [Bacteroidales bacterium]HQH14480.1 tRNA (adenosine(37)-N6)-threonylcarbamoyltransferase complex ATPase subunit type 1 TsaE [Bacteroidales bacterium]